MTVLKLGFLVNPIAGMGGKVGLKGTNNVSKKAVALGATPVAPTRAVEFLKRLRELKLEPQLSLITCPSMMGEEEVRSAGLETKLLRMPLKIQTTADDTKRAVKLMAELKVDLIVFVGGDGTARDILDELHDADGLPVLGVPSGVKMYSGIFAINPRDAADLVEAFLHGEAQITEFEIMDADEDAIRKDRFDISLYGVLKGPFLPMRIVGSKQVSPETLDERENQIAVARFVVEEMKPNATYILGPGGTVKCVADLLGVKKTLLGVDIYRQGKVMKDVSEKQILREVANWNTAWVVASPIGRQGMLFGRGNQQISSEVLRRVSKEHVIVLATKSKIQGIDGGVLRVDTNDETVDRMFRGFIKVASDYREWLLMEIV